MLSLALFRFMFFILKSMWINDGSADKCLSALVWSPPGCQRLLPGGVSKVGPGYPWADRRVHRLPGLPVPPPSRVREGLKDETLWAHLYKINK